VGCIHRTSSHAEIQFVLKSEIRDYFPFAFVSPEGTNNDGAGHANSQWNQNGENYLKTSFKTGSIVG
jgi:hypothetical protein